MSETQRITARHQVNAYVDVSSLRDVLLYHDIQNISLGGICIRTTTPHEVGQIVDVTVNFPDMDTAIVAKGQVVWANRMPPQDVGIRWVDLDHATRLTLERHIQAVSTQQICDEAAPIDEDSAPGAQQHAL